MAPRATLRRAAIFLAACAALAGCTTMRGSADSAFDHGDYLKAAELYDRVVAADPNDSDAKALRTSARSAAMRQMLADAQSARRNGRVEDANARLAQLLEKRDLWSQGVDGSIAAPFAVEIAAAA